MEELNKQQIILLALLVSFVSSIAAGITAVSLMGQEPNVPVTQTINRVVERTIERVSSDVAAPAAATKETIVVREDQAAVDAIAIASKAIVRIFAVRPGFPDEFMGLGVIADSSGKVIARLGPSVGGILTARLDGGNSVLLSPAGYDAATGISTLSAENAGGPYDTRAYAAARFADSDAARLGQAVILVGGEEDARVATGIVSMIGARHIEASVKDPAFDTHAILVNLLGEVLGMKDLTVPAHSFVASNRIQSI